MRNNLTGLLRAVPERNTASDSFMRPGDAITFFPTYGYRHPDGSGWRVNVHGWVYRPQESSLKRAAVLSLLRRAARLDRDTIASIAMQGRLRPFLFDNKRGRRISVQLGTDVYELPASKANGHFAAAIDVADDRLPAAVSADGESIRPLSLCVANRSDSDITAAVRLLSEEGVSVISDIDDTIKISQVTDRRELMANTFLREFRSVPKMADVYRGWADAGAAFHYVSAGAWQLFSPLNELLSTGGFPEGSMHLRDFRLKDRSLVKFLSDTDLAKKTVCERILRDFPRRRFVLVGDSGERDPEMYAGLARDYAAQIRHIYIRNISGDSRGAERYRQAFAGIADDVWTLFDNVSEIDRMV